MALLTQNGNYLINNLFVSPEGKVLREIKDESELKYLEEVCEKVELPDNFDLSEVERYKTFAELLSQELEVVDKARKDYFMRLTNGNESWRFGNLGNYDIRDLEPQDFFSDFGGEDIYKIIIKKGMANTIYDKIRISDFDNDPPLYIIIFASYQEFNETQVASKIILRCKNTFASAIAKAEKIASIREAKLLEQ